MSEGGKTGNELRGAWRACEDACTRYRAGFEELHGSQRICKIPNHSNLHALGPYAGQSSNSSWTPLLLLDQRHVPEPPAQPLPAIQALALPFATGARDRHQSSRNSSDLFHRDIARMRRVGDQGMMERLLGLCFKGGASVSDRKHTTPVSSDSDSPPPYSPTTPSPAKQHCRS